MKKKLLLLLTFISLWGYSQETVTTSGGKDVIINKDGTWSYKESAQKNTDSGTNCAKYIKSVKDPQSGAMSHYPNGKFKYASDNGNVGVETILLLSKDQKSLIASFKTTQPDCIASDAKIVFIFSDIAQLEMSSNNAENCKGEITKYFGGEFGDLNFLEQLLIKGRTIKNILIQSKTAILSYELTDKESEIFQNTLSCLSKNLITETPKTFVQEQKNESGSQLKKVTIMPREQIGKIQQFGRTLDAEITKYENLYTVSYKDIKFKKSDIYRSFSFEGENTLNDLYNTIQEGFNTMPKDGVMLELPNYYIYLHFEKFLGTPTVTMTSSGKGRDDDSYVSLQITKKNIEKLFGKRE